MSGKGFGLHFGRLLVTLGSLCLVVLGYLGEVGILTDPLGTSPGFSRLLMDFGSPLGPTLESFCRFSRNVDHKIAVRILGLFF